MHTLKGLSDERRPIYNYVVNSLKFSFCTAVDVKMRHCRLCYGKAKKDSVYCSDKCKLVWKDIKASVKAQRDAFDMVRKCSTCKKKLTSEEGKYCEKCIIRAKKIKDERIKKKSVRPCKECGEQITDASPNQKWCDICVIPIRRADKARRTRISRAKAKPKEQVKPKEKSISIDPKWLTRGTITDNTRASSMAC